ncbi:MAG: DsbA family protein [Acholeplasmataceae bacterium]|nr:DsbA family protein [Acholeplasmataceae bacterium]
MKLEFWLDYLSPLCYKQHKSIESLLKDYQFKDLEILYRSYEMIPLFESKPDCSFELIMSKHHMITIEEAKKLMPQFNEHVKPVKVLDAHRLSHLAKKFDCAFEFNKNVFKAYYEDNMDISNFDVLTEIALMSGMKAEHVHAVLYSNQFANAVESNRENAILKGIFELPHLRIDGKIRLNGYHDEKQVLQQLNRASAVYSKTEHCEGENCGRK